MPKFPGLTKLEQGKILAYSSANMSIRDVAKAVGRSKSVVHAFLKNPEGYGTKKSLGRSRLLKIHYRTRLRRYASTGEYTANQLHQELNIDASARTVQRELQRRDYLAFEKANKSPCMTTHHKMMRVAWVERQIRLRTD
jgi:transposase